MDTDTILKYEWQQRVLDAFLEFTPERMPEKVGIAERTITERLQDQQKPDERERAALNDALHLLHAIFPGKRTVYGKNEVCYYPRSSRRFGALCPRGQRRRYEQRVAAAEFPAVRDLEISSQRRRVWLQLCSGIRTLLPPATFLALSAIFLPFTAFGQNCSAQIHVLVLDGSGTVIPNAKVWLGNDSAGALPSDEDGVTVFENRSCGPLTVHATSDGFQTEEKTVQIASAEPVEVTLALFPLTVRENMEVRAIIPAIEASSSTTGELRPEEVKELPSVPSTVADALVRLPGLLRSADGQITISGTGEHHGAFVVNQADVTDPATGKFGPTLPVEVVEAINVSKAPFQPEYGRFTSGIVAVDTHRGGDKWHAELNDPFPDFRIRSGHMDGLRNSTPRLLLGGPILRNRLYLISEVQYYLDKHPNLTLPYPYNESKQELVNSFSQFDYVISSGHLITGSFHVAPQHINFVNPEFFNPQPVTPSYTQHDYEWTFADHMAVGRGTLASTVAFQQFSATVRAQGDAEMFLSPNGNSGNYFARQYREAHRGEWLEAWSPGQLSWIGGHEVKIGGSLDFLANQGQFTANPVNIVDLSNRLLRRLEFNGGSPYRVTDTSVAAFVQDRWTVKSRVVLDGGMRLERQGVAGNLRLAPRLGVSWAPFKNSGTILRAGYGRFYDRVPLDVYTFDHYPRRMVTDYALDGSGTVNVSWFENSLGTDAGPHSFWVHNKHRYGGFAPRNATWKFQVEQKISRQLSLQALYENSRSAGLVELEQFGETDNLLQLSGGGRSFYRQTEIRARVDWKKGQQFFLSYAHSRARGHLNDFNGFVGDFPMPLVRPDLLSNLPGDSPNRFLAWGRLSAPLGLYLLPLIEFRNGFPYAVVDTLGNYVGMPNNNRTRFPNFFSADMRWVKDVRYRSKYTLRFSLSGFNLTNHFNALSVHANTGDPLYGTFFGNYTRRYRGDFEVLF